MANYKYSFQNPMRLYQGYKQELTDVEFSLFRQKYERVARFKRVTYWVASKTGETGARISPTEKTFYISDAIGRVYYFPYLVQREFLSRMNYLNSAGQQEPINWTAMTTNNLLIGYALNMIDGITSDDWDEGTLSHYLDLCDKIVSGNVKALFVPYYLAPKMYKPIIRHSLLATQGIFGVGAAFLYDYSNGCPDSPCAVIPDVDFITQFDLTAFKALDLSQMYIDYNNLMDSNSSFASKHIRCDFPKPKPIVLKVGDDGVKSNNSDNTQNNQSSSKMYTSDVDVDVSNKSSDIETKIKSDAAKLKSLYTILSVIKESLLGVKSESNRVIVESSEIIPLVGNNILMKLSLYSINLDMSFYCSSKMFDELQNSSRLLLYNTKQKQNLYLNIILNALDETYLTTVGLYGSDSLGMEISSGSYSTETLSRLSSSESNELFKDFILEFVDDSFYYDVILESYSFEEQVFRGIYDGINEIKSLSKLNIGESEITNANVVETVDKYMITFSNSVIKSLSIRNSSTSALEYSLLIDADMLGYSPEELSSVYVGDGSITDTVKTLIVETLNSLS
jgi:hypothetical protein